MPSDYQAIRADNERRYGTDIGRIGPMLLADRYDDRTHFIFELLQNAEDALARRTRWQGPRSVTFDLTKEALRFSHFGIPFSDADVRGICGIAEGTKDFTDIGRFGIGFKSVYAFTDRPEVHSGTENFAIESFVWPAAAPALDRDEDETVILIPLKACDESDHEEIAAGLRRLGASALLFLRQIEEINWCVQDGPSGLYVRESRELDEGVRRINVIGEVRGKTEVHEDWLVFSRPVSDDYGRFAGHAEIAFSIAKDDSQREFVQRVERSPLAVFFPTVIETHLGFLVQGPYRTTPSRDNVPRNDPWNQRLVQETAALLVEALRWLRDHGLLDTTVLQCLPLDKTKFGEAAMFAPLFAATKQALWSEPLLPRFRTGHVPASRARLARTKELRELLSSKQLAALLDTPNEVHWLSGDITRDTAPTLRSYLLNELGVSELTPEVILPRLTRPFLEAQSDKWICKLYAFLHGQPALIGSCRVSNIPLVRLESGTHVVAQSDGQPQAFLPGQIKTDFPTVRRSVCGTPEALELLKALELTEPDGVDDVVRNLLPKYGEAEASVSEADYAADIQRILAASGTDSQGQREKLVNALRETAFVMAVDAGDGTKRISKPGMVYLAEERLRDLFAGVRGVLLVDDAYPCLRSEDVRKLLEECGASRCLKTIRVEADLSWVQLSEIRRNAGLERATSEWPIDDAMVHGLPGLLKLLPRLDVQTRRHRAELLWEALADLMDRSGKNAFVCTYRWSYSRETKTASFDAAFIRYLNSNAWVPDANGELQRPELIAFDTLGWQPYASLQSTIRFRPPVIEALAREAGVEPAVLDLLKQHGITTEAELRQILAMRDESDWSSGVHKGSVRDAVNKPHGDTPGPTLPAPETGSQVPVTSGCSKSGDGRGIGSGAWVEQGDGHDAPGNGDIGGCGSPGARRTPGGTGGRPFVSYVGAHPEDEAPDPDGLDHVVRMALEENAIELILKREPGWRRAPTHIAGFDLYEANEQGSATRWCEVKAMTGRLTDRPVGLSHMQFEWACEHGEAYWLYVVECAGTDEARLVRIQNPAGKARTFTFDHGWLSMAEPDAVQQENTGA